MENTVKLSLKKNDVVQIIAGKDKGKTGKVLKVDSKNLKILVESVNVVKRHVKPSQQNPQGGIVQKELPLHYSNVLLMCSKCSTGRKHTVKMVGAAGKQSKVRVCKKCGESLEAKA